MNIKMHKWIMDPFPYCVIDNFLSEEEFSQLTIELDITNNSVQKVFNSSLENKLILKDTAMKRNVKKLVKKMGSLKIKNVISEIIENKNIVSMRDFDDYGGYSPYHITENNGFLGSHVDHSSIKGGELCHIANTIFYASNRWEKGWGGQTILFSKNGFSQEVKIDPLPNRLIFFIHTANSFHGVSRYYSHSKVQRRTFYHDFYVSKNEIKEVMNKVNFDRKHELIYSIHGTTFIPFLPFGIKYIKLKNFLSLKNFKYLPSYFLYYLNRLTNSKYPKLKSVISFENILFLINLIRRK